MIRTCEFDFFNLHDPIPDVHHSFVSSNGLNRSRKCSNEFCQQLQCVPGFLQDLQAGWGLWPPCVSTLHWLLRRQPWLRIPRWASQSKSKQVKEHWMYHNSGAPTGPMLGATFDIAAMLRNVWTSNCFTHASQQRKHRCATYFHFDHLRNLAN